MKNPLTPEEITARNARTPRRLALARLAAATEDARNNADAPVPYRLTALALVALGRAPKDAK